jgi:hypothetical protein
MFPAILVMLPGALVMLPGALVMLPERLVMFPANAEEEIAKVKSDAQRIDLKRFILILLVIERLLGRSVRRDCHLKCQILDLTFRLTTCSAFSTSRLVPRQSTGESGCVST